MAYAITECGDDLDVKFFGEVTFRTISVFQDMIKEIVDKTPNKVFVDMSEVKQIDSTGIGAFLELKKSVPEQRVVLKNISADVDYVIKMAKFDQLFTIQDS